MKNWLYFLLSFFSTILLVYALNTRIGSTPPIGKFLDPAGGIWQNARISTIPESQTIDIPGLKDEVRVVFNDRAVPHIFAKNDHDLHLASGYITAQHRLWQMEFATHASIGRISEIVGPVAINYDRHQRRIGMLHGARQAFEKMNQDEWSRSAVEAYSKGVNAWIDQLTDKNLPFEYKLLDYKPEPWTPFKTAIFYMNMSKTLTFGTNAFNLSHMKRFLGEEIVHVLFPTIPPNNKPIITEGTKWDFNPLTKQKPEVPFTPQIVENAEYSQRDPSIGSNNWAIDGSKTASGAAMMATDPHLTLSLPSIWYEAQYNAPGINAYGITLPGVPAIIMGFNEKIAWGNTNTGGGSLDIYEIELNDDNSAYFHDGKWKPTTPVVETFIVRGEESRKDTIYFTHHGPISYLPHELTFEADIPVGHAISWIAHYPANAIKSFYHINRAQNLAEFRTGLSTLASPTQNYVFASVDGDIAIQLNGLHPVRWEHQGKFIGDGRDPAYDWDEFIPFEHLPREINPARGFVSSANQLPFDANYPYYFEWFFAPQARATIINNTLSNLTNATHHDMIALQMNSDNYWANTWLDAKIDFVDTYLANRADATFEVDLAQNIDLLRNWNRINEAQSVEARLFDAWQRYLRNELWTELADSLKGVPYIQPHLNLSYEVLFNQYAADEYHQITQKHLDIGEILTETLVKSIEYLEKQENKAWWHQNGSTINHPLNIRALNEPRLQVSGSRYSPNAINNIHGPSWRMVVEMTNPVQAWGVYPGGQTGNPASKDYNAFIKDWSEGDHYELKLHKDYESAAVDAASIVILTPSGK